MREPTPDQVSNFWRYMLIKYQAQVVDKNDAVEMKALAMLLGKLGIADPTSFMKRYATTIGRRIYVPFDIGEPSPNWSLWTQMMTCAHECQHIEQLSRLGPLRYAWKYVGSKRERALLEAEAYRCQLELHHWHTGEIIPPEKLAAHLKSYAVTDTDIQVAETVLRMSAESVKRGAVVNRASHVAIDYLDDYARDLRAPSN